MNMRTQILFTHAMILAALTAPVYAGSIQTSSTDPGSAASSLAPANDTKINQRDRSASSITSTDQPNDQTDIKLAARVRHAIFKDKSLSTSAHNVKLVVTHGQVTLRDR